MTNKQIATSENIILLVYLWGWANQQNLFVIVGNLRIEIYDKTTDELDKGYIAHLLAILDFCLLQLACKYLNIQ